MTRWRNCMHRIFITLSAYHTLLGRSHRNKGGGQNMKHAWGRLTFKMKRLLGELGMDRRIILKCEMLGSSDCGL